MPRCISCLLALLAGLLCLPASATEVLRILTWPGYTDSDWVQAFAEQHQVQVEVTEVGSDDELQEKFAAHGGNDYDLIAANTVEIAKLRVAERLLPLRLDNIPNRNRQLRQFRNLLNIPGIGQAGEVYAMPFAYGEMGLIYNKVLIKEPPRSIESLWDPKLRGKVLAYNGSSHNFSLASLALGRQPFHIAPNEWPNTADKLIALRRNVLSFYMQPEEVVELFRKHSVALIYANYGLQQLKMLEQNGAQVGYSIPKEGALAWLDCWAINRSTPRRLLAEQWIDFSLNPAISHAITERHGINNTLEKPPFQAGGKLLWLEQVEDPARRAKLWRRILAGESPEQLKQP